MVQLKTAKAQFAVEFIDLPAAAQVEGARWEAFQLAFLNNDSRLSLDVKSRQIAWSFISTVDAVVDGVLNPNTPHVFVSLNQDEAKEKIRYTRAVIEAIDSPARPKVLRDSQTEIELENGSRFISHPCRPVRGKAQARVYLDEMAHYPNGLDRQVYLAALPATTKGNGYIRIGSSPLGAKGLFWEIASEGLRPWPGFSRRFVPWWQVRAFCRDVSAARQAATEMPTHERVYSFGAPALTEIFENMFLEDFQQEYECAWVDELNAWITWEVIQRNQQPDLQVWQANNVDQALAMLGDIERAIGAREIEQSLVAGIDVGRKKDKTEFVGVGKNPSKQLPVRIMISLDKTPYDAQESLFVEVIRRLPLVQVLVDQNGIGSQLAENLARKTGKAQGVDFTNQTKELWAVEARLQAERGATPLPMDRDLAYQIHSIKKTTTAAKNNVFDTERNEKHHADKFWAWALAIWAGRGNSIMDYYRQQANALAEAKRKESEKQAQAV